MKSVKSCMKQSLEVLQNLGHAAWSIAPMPIFASIVGSPCEMLPFARPYSEFAMALEPCELLPWAAQALIPGINQAPPSFLPQSRLRDFFWRPSRLYPVGTQGQEEEYRRKERWFFINGILTDRAVAERNVRQAARGGL